MNQAELLYNQGVQWAEQADIARIKRYPVDYKSYYAKASELERDAALLLSAEDKNPLSRGVLLRSAAALAYKAGDFKEAEKLIALARSENPMGYEAAKLDDIEEAIRKALAALPSDQSLTVTGTFTAADVDEKEIKIRELESHQLYSFIVPAAMFRKIAKSYLLEVVSVVGKSSPMGVLTLEKISPVTASRAA